MYVYSHRHICVREILCILTILFANILKIKIDDNICKGENCWFLQHIKKL